LIIFLPVIMVVSLAIVATSKGPAIHWSKRIGRNNNIFLMPKFRTMSVDTPQVATHLLKDSVAYITPMGSFLRKSSMDELPQLWSIIIGDMSFVGPRPALFNQIDLQQMRTDVGVHVLTPGLTGWAQINGRDDLPLDVKVRFDFEYLQKKSFWLDLVILAHTVRRVLFCANISH